MRVTKPAYEWAGEHRPPRAGEWYRSAIDGSIRRAEDDYPLSGHLDIYREMQAQYEVEDPVPEWIADCGGHDVPYSLLQTFAAAFRTHVESRAKSIARRYAHDEHPVTVETLVREEFLR